MKQQNEKLEEFIEANKEILLSYYRQLNCQKLSFEEFARLMLNQYLKMLPEEATEK